MKLKPAMSRPDATLSARVIHPDGTVVDLGTICGKGHDEPETVR